MLSARFLRAAVHSRGARSVTATQARPPLRTWRHLSSGALDKGSSAKPSELSGSSFVCSVRTGWLAQAKAAMAGRPSRQHEGLSSFKVECLNHGTVYRLQGLGLAGLPTRRRANQIADVLSIKVAFEQGQPLRGGLALHSRSRRFRGNELTKAGRSELAGISFQELFEQIKCWVERLHQYEVMPSLLYQAADCNSLVGARLLLFLDPAAASVADARLPGASPLGAACRAGNAQLVQLLLQAAPHMARVPDRHGHYPIHRAAASGNVRALRPLLQVATETAGVGFWSEDEVAAEHDKLLARGDLSRPDGTDEPWYDPWDGLPLEGKTPLHLAAISSPVAVELLLEAAPEAALEPDREGRLPLHEAASTGCVGAVRLLLAAAPEAALRTAGPAYMSSQLEQLHARGVLRSKRAGQGRMPRAPADVGLTPLHIAAFWGRSGAVLELLAAAPAAAAMEDRYGCTPLQLALAALSDKKMRTSTLWSDPRSAVLVLLNTCSLPDAFEALLNAGPEALPLFRELVAARLPLAEAEWALLPAPCPGLLPALPAALAHSLEHARRLVRRLPPAEKQRLRAAAQSLGQERQREARTRLPVAAAQQLLFEQLHAEGS